MPVPVLNVDGRWLLLFLPTLHQLLSSCTFLFSLQSQQLVKLWARLRKTLVSAPADWLHEFTLCERAKSNSLLPISHTLWSQILHDYTRFILCLVVFSCWRVHQGPHSSRPSTLRLTHCIFHESPQPPALQHKTQNVAIVDLSTSRISREAIPRGGHVQGRTKELLLSPEKTILVHSLRCYSCHRHCSGSRPWCRSFGEFQFRFSLIHTSTTPTGKHHLCHLRLLLETSRWCVLANRPRICAQ